MDSGQRRELLKLIRSGLDVEAGAAKLGISMAEVRKGGAKLQRAINDSFALASARLRAKLLEGALDGNDMKLLSNILERREAAQVAAAAAAGIRAIRVEMVEAKCPHCGKRPYINEAAPEAQGISQAVADQPRPEPAAQVKQPYTRRYGPSVRPGGI